MSIYISHSYCFCSLNIIAKLTCVFLDVVCFTAITNFCIIKLFLFCFFSLCSVPLFICQSLEHGNGILICLIALLKWLDLMNSGMNLICFCSQAFGFYSCFKISVQIRQDLNQDWIVTTHYWVIRVCHITPKDDSCFVPDISGSWWLTQLFSMQKILS